MTEKTRTHHNPVPVEVREAAEALHLLGAQTQAEAVEERGHLVAGERGRVVTIRLLELCMRVWMWMWVSG